MHPVPDTKRLIGLTEIQASQVIAAYGGHVNIVMRDGIPCERITYDCRLDRVNIELRGDRVVRAFVG